MCLKWDAHLGFAERRSARIRPLVVNWLRRSHPAPALNAVIVLLGALVMAAVPAVGTAHDGVQHWHCDPSEGNIRQVACTFEWGGGEQPDEGDLQVHGFLHAPNCQSLPARSPLRTGGLQVVRGSSPPPVGTGPGGNTFTYTANAQSAALDRCILAVASLRRGSGNYSLIQSAVFAVDFENGQVPGAGAASGGPWHLPLLFACRLDGPIGFVRIVNLRNANNRLRIQAFDESGANCENAVNLGPNQALHFNSCDLDNGNRDKGLRGCAAGQGHWRLVVEPAGADPSDRSFFVGAYARTGSGDSEWAFLTSMHDYAEGIPNAGDATYPTLYAVPVFNPGRNVNQVSRLRVTNLGDASRSYILAAVDDAGDIRGVTIGPVARGATEQFAADVLEDSWGLGQGRGKWFLVVGGGPALVVHLMQSAAGRTAGQWTNLTSVAPVAPYYNQEDIVRIFRQAQRDVSAR